MKFAKMDEPSQAVRRRASESLTSESPALRAAASSFRGRAITYLPDVISKERSHRSCGKRMMTGL